MEAERTLTTCSESDDVITLDTLEGNTQESHFKRATTKLSTLKTFSSVMRKFINKEGRE